jgi:hypothetical protein
MVDEPDLNPGAFGRAGSTPARSNALVVKQVDTLDSNPSADGVEVRFLSGASVRKRR